MRRAEAGVSQRNTSETITKRAFAETFGVSEAQLERYFQQGMPHEKASTRKIMIPMPAGRVWYHEYLVNKGRKQAAPTTLDEAKQRREAAQAELAELDLAERRGELMHVSDYEQLVGDAFARVRARLTNLPSRLAGVVVGCETIQEAQARVDPLVREAMDELQRAVDVPEPDERDEAA